ncbi:MAG: serine/threonine protein kinase [Pyrinomonadaceae bacterium]|nr:serine/threonine protein kinase [Phycisphaerales bacterium]
MNAQRFRRIEELFNAAADLPVGERTRFIDLACEDDEQVKRDVRLLIEQHDPRSTFIEPPNPPAVRPERHIRGARIGRYTIRRVIASGGMGTVYEADQHRPIRKVALKVMQAGLASESARRRFEFESQVLGLLRHPNVAQVYEAGVHEDAGGAVPFFAMELVEDSVTITGFARNRQGATTGAGPGKDSPSMPTDRRQIESVLETFLQACAAVCHGHQQGVIHRDLKPANILVDGSGTVKVIDFGVARLITQNHDQSHTVSEPGRVMGTLAYMSPEQVGQRVTDDGPFEEVLTIVGPTPSPDALAARRSEIDIRTDVYSLGLVLYEMLCGAPPYHVGGCGLLSAVDIIQTQPPTRPSSLNPALRGDLETIVLKALEKDRERRYPSVEALARDLECFRRMEPIDARPPTAIYQVRMFARRNRAIVGAASAIAAVLVIATGVSMWFAARAAVRAKETEQARSRAQRSADYLEGVLASANPWFPPAIPRNDELADYEPWDEWQNSPWPYAGMPGRAASTLDVLWAAAQRVSVEFADDPLTRARLSDSLGWTLARLLTTEQHPLSPQMSAMAEQLLREALRIRRDALGGGDERTLRTLFHLAEFLDYRPGGAAEAERYYDEGWNICRAQYGASHPRTLHALRSWANNVAFYQDRRADALRRMSSQLESVMDPGAQASPALLMTLAYYGYVLSFSDHASGRRLSLDAYERLERVAGPLNIRTAYAGRYVTTMLLDAGDATRAAEVARDTQHAEAAFFGPDSLEAAHRLGSCVRALSAQQLWHDAIEPARHALTIFRGIRGPAHAETLTAQWALSVVLWYAREHLDESERLAMDVHGRLAASEGEGAQSTLWCAIHIIGAALHGPKLLEALEFIERQRTLIERDPARLQFLGQITSYRARCLRLLGRDAEAIAAFVHAFEVAAHASDTNAVLADLRERLLEHIAVALAGHK